MKYLNKFKKFESPDSSYTKDGTYLGWKKKGAFCFGYFDLVKEDYDTEYREGGFRGKWNLGDIVIGKAGKNRETVIEKIIEE